MNIKRIVIAYALIGVFIGWPVVTGMFQQSDHSIYEGHEDQWRKYSRHNLGENMALGLGYALMWPVGIPLALMMTGFAEHGVWTYQPSTTETI